MRRIPRLPLVLGALLLLPVAGAEIARARATRDDDPSGFGAGELRSARTWAAVHRCWLGAPLAPGETVGDRVRRIAIDVPPSKEEGAWPRRCAATMAQFVEQVYADPNHAMAGDHFKLRELETQLEDGNPSPPDRDMVASGWLERASKLEPATQVTAAPAPAAVPIPWGEELLLPYLLVNSQGVGADGRFRVAFGFDGLRVCTAEPDGKRLACAFAPDSLPADNPSFFSSGGGQALLEASRSPTATAPRTGVIVEADSGRVAWSGPEWVHDAMIRDGTFFGLLDSSGVMSLVTVGPDGKSVRKHLAVSAPEFFDDHVLDVGERVHVLPLTGAAPPLDLGSTPARDGRGARDRISSVCRTEQAAFALDGELLVRHRGTAWQAYAVPRDATLACSGSTANLTVLVGATLERLDCDETCIARKVQRPEVAGKQAAVACGEDVLLFEDRAGAVRFAAGSFESMSNGAHKPLLETVAPGYGGSGRLEELRAVPVTGGALVLARFSQGYAVTRVGCDGSVTRVNAGP